MSKTLMDEVSDAMTRGIAPDLFEHEMVTNSRVLGRETGLNVVIGGDQAKTDGKTIVLPALNRDGVVDREAANVARGFVNHEAAHLRYTNMHTVKRFSKHAMHSSFLNGMEDVRIERNFSQQYTGSQRHFEAAANATLKRFLDQVKSGKIKIDDPKKLVPMATSWLGRQKNGFSIDTALMEKLSDLVGESGMKVADQLSDVAVKASSTLDISRYLEKWLGKVAPETEAERRHMPIDGPAGGSGDGEGEGGGEGKGEGADDDDDGEGGGADGAHPSIGTDTPREWTPPSSGKGFFDPSTAETLSEMLDINRSRTGTYLSDLNQDCIWSDFGHMMKTIIGGTSRSAKEVIDEATSVAGANDEHRLYLLSSAFPNDMMEARKLGLHIAGEMRSNLGPATRAMKMALERGLVIARQRDWDPGQSRGYIDPKRLASVMTGTRNLYRRRSEMDLIDTAVTLLIDQSGSMSGEKMIEAMRSAFVFAEALDKVGIPIEVLGFDSDRKKIKNPDGVYDRYGAIDIMVYKAFDEPLKTHVWKIGLMNATAHCKRGGQNADGDSLVHAWRRLRVRQEPRKVLIVFSDGRPAASGSGDESHHLKNVVAQMMVSGIEPFGVGIMDDSVRHFYPQYIVINNAEDLPSKAGNFMRNLLIPKEKRQRAARKTLKRNTASRESAKAAAE